MSRESNEELLLRYFVTLSDFKKSPNAHTSACLNSPFLSFLGLETSCIHRPRTFFLPKFVKCLLFYLTRKKLPEKQKLLPFKSFFQGPHRRGLYQAQCGRGAGCGDGGRPRGGLGAPPPVLDRHRHGRHRLLRSRRGDEEDGRQGRAGGAEGRRGLSGEGVRWIIVVLWRNWSNFSVFFCPNFLPSAFVVCVVVDAAASLTAAAADVTAAVVVTVKANSTHWAQINNLISTVWHKCI